LCHRKTWSIIRRVHAARMKTPRSSVSFAALLKQW
jgi:hypothetical protein